VHLGDQHRRRRGVRLRRDGGDDASAGDFPGLLDLVDPGGDGQSPRAIDDAVCDLAVPVCRLGLRAALRARQKRRCRAGAAFLGRVPIDPLPWRDERQCLNLNGG